MIELITISQARVIPDSTKISLCIRKHGTKCGAVAEREIVEATQSALETIPTQESTRVGVAPLSQGHCIPSEVYTIDIQGCPAMGSSDKTSVWLILKPIWRSGENEGACESLKGSR